MLHVKVGNMNMGKFCSLLLDMYGISFIALLFFLSEMQ